MAAPENAKSTPAIKLTELNPRDAAAALVAELQDQRGWLDEFAETLDRHRAGQSLARVLSAWDLSQSHAARLFGVQRQALSKWIEHGAPAERAEAIADLAAATALLVHHLQRDRIPAVVRRSSAALGDRSLIDLLAIGRTRTLLVACRDMFRFDRPQD